MNIELKGTEKQIAYADDIINKPLFSLEQQAKLAERLEETDKAEIIRKTIEEYEHHVCAIVAKAETDGLEGGNTSAFIIKKRFFFAELAHKVLRKILHDAGHDNWYTDIAMNINGVKS